MPKHNDHKYIEALKANNTALIDEIYQKWFPEVRNYVAKNNGDGSDAADLFQEALMAILHKARKNGFELNVPFGGYFYFIYRNKWIDKLRKNKKMRVINEEDERYKDEVATKTIAKQTLEEDDRYQLYKLCFKNLTEACQEVLRLTFEGLSPKVIKEQLNFASVNSANQRIHRCRGNLQKIIKAHPKYISLLNT